MTDLNNLESYNTSIIDNNFLNTVDNYRVTSSLGYQYNALNCSCYDGFNNMKENSIDLVLTDIPYAVTANKWDAPLDLPLMWQGLKRVCKDNANILIFCNEPFATKLRMSNFKNFRYNIIWQKRLPTGFLNANVQPLKIHEIINVFFYRRGFYSPIKSEGKPYYKRAFAGGSTYKKHKAIDTNNATGERYPLDVINFKGVTVKGRLNPSEKPIKLLEYLIKTYSNKNATVLDFTAGSFSTCLACYSTQRNFVGFELDKDMYNRALPRLKTYLNQLI